MRRETITTRKVVVLITVVLITVVLMAVADTKKENFGEGKKWHFKIN